MELPSNLRAAQRATTRDQATSLVERRGLLAHRPARHRAEWRVASTSACIDALANALLLNLRGRFSRPPLQGAMPPFDPFGELGRAELHRGGQFPEHADGWLLAR